MQDLMETILGRRTIPLFKATKEVPQELVEKAIEAASWAPNHHLTEPWRFYQLGPETTRAYLDLLFNVIKEYKSEKLANFKVEKGKTVPGWLVVTCANTGEGSVAKAEDYAAVSCAIQNMALVLWEAGVGMKWSTGIITRDDRFYELLGINRNFETIVGLIPYGYPKEIPEARDRKSVDQILSLLE